MARLTLNGARGPTPLPPYEPPYIPLSAGKILKLGSMVDGGGRQTAIDKLAKTLGQALDTLGSIVADLGELVPVGKDDHDEEQAEKQALLDDMDAMARSLVDAHYKTVAMKSVLLSVVTDFRDEGREARKRQREGEDEHGAAEIAGEAEGLVGKYEDGLRKKIRDHGNSSMVARYGQVTEYVEFRRYLWNAQHPDQTNSMPRPNTWFAHLEGRRKSQAHLDVEEDSDIEIAQEKQSYTCPLTLRSFKTPLTSTLCPHSFEKLAVEDYLNKSGGTASCPVSGCSQQLTLAVLRPDPVLERDVRRAAQRAQRDQQEEEDNIVEVEDRDRDDDQDEEMADVDDLRRRQTIPVKNEKAKRRVRGKAETESEEEEEEEEED